jgi:hypothetical protein
MDYVYINVNVMMKKQMNIIKHVSVDTENMMDIVLQIILVVFPLNVEITNFATKNYLNGY